MSRRIYKVECPDCSTINEVDVELAKRTPLKPCCVCCSAKVDLSDAVKTFGSDGVKRSRNQEKRSAKRNRARRQAGSGSSIRAKGDIKDRGRLHGECKHTVRRTFTLKLDDLMKAEMEARAGELVLFEVEFQGVHPFKRYVVLSDSAYQALASEVEH